MTTNNNYTSAFKVACVDLYHLEFIASNFTRSARLLYEQGNGSAHTQSFHLLVSMAFELFPKIIIGCDTCLMHQGDVHLSEYEIRANIMSAQQKFGHDLKRLFEKCPDLCEQLGVVAITKVPDDTSKEWFVNEYRFEIESHPFLLSIKNVEAVRYGSFSHNRDIAIDCTGDEMIMKLLLSLQEFVRNKRIETVQQIKKAL